MGDVRYLAAEPRRKRRAHCFGQLFKGDKAVGFSEIDFLCSDEGVP